MHHSPQPVNGSPPSVSVVIPTHDRRRLLETCLEALARQSYVGFDVIVVDDFSTDDTVDYLTAFSKSCPMLRLRWFRNPTSLGANPSRNRAIRESSAGFVAFLDSDCQPSPDWLERLMTGFTDDSVASVTGLVIDHPPRNIFDLTFKGTHRVHAAAKATRLVGGNMCIRRKLLLLYSLDEDLGGGCDEEGIFRLLRANGYRQRFVPDAVVYHEHHYSGRSFFRQAYRGGCAAARLVYKYHLSPRLDMLPFILAYATMPLLIFSWRIWVIPTFFMFAALAAILYNDLIRKRKTLVEMLLTFPILLAYYHVRLFGYVTTAITVRWGIPHIQRIRLERSTHPMESQK